MNDTQKGRLILLADWMMQTVDNYNLGRTTERDLCDDLEKYMKRMTNVIQEIRKGLGPLTGSNGY